MSDEHYCFSCGREGLATRAGAGECEGCHVSTYCSQQCQRRDWEEGRHDQACQHIGVIDGGLVFGIIIGIALVGVSIAAVVASIAGLIAYIHLKIVGKFEKLLPRLAVQGMLRAVVLIDVNGKLMGPVDRRKMNERTAVLYSRWNDTVEESRLGRDATRKTTMYNVAKIADEKFTEMASQGFSGKAALMNPDPFKTGWIDEVVQRFMDDPTVQRWSSADRRKLESEVRNWLGSVLNYHREWHTALRQEFAKNEDTPFTLDKRELKALAKKLKTLQNAAISDAERFGKWFDTMVQ